ncbi:hypothetical protein PGT21_020018 [Puccinia graminis f. sp. tritici]|uniref:Uncharacterized protein n=1 Tax=Puccinia graminis f. sp. tritici TaxID=56615 RepID=A0A5B0S184_PUCGR|nr:hypothetical protein PGT21_020018 [Puccinia graminis f. sp. tritici]KAA1131891.1 hypothetical protein PGTUg99_032532 [Puccinia graminis f. sp. tritici]
MDSQEAAWWSEIIPDNTSLSTTVLRSQTVSSFLQDFGKRYVLRKMLDSYLSSTSQPSSDVIDLMFWGIVVNKPEKMMMNFQRT